MDFLKRSWVEIDLDSIVANYKAVVSAAGGAKVMAVVKADAYGHGAACVAPVLEENGAEYFAVSNIDEAMELRYAGVKSPVLILGHTPEEYAALLAENNIAQAVMSASYGKALAYEAKKAGVVVKSHIKLDTGMGRIGFVCREGMCPEEEIAQVLAADSLSFDGIFTHFACADTDDKYTAKQYARFSAVCDALEKKGFVPNIRHCSNSAGALLHKDMKMDMVRAGIILYGLTPDTSLRLPSEFSPAMAFYSTIAQIKELPAGEAISYGGTHITDKNTTCATLPVGYADGWRRALSGKGNVLCHGKKAPVLGRVCMDQTVVDVSAIPEAREGDTVLLFGKGNPVEEIADICGTINYEIVCGISRRVPRVYLCSGRPAFAKTYIYEEEK